MKGDAFLRGGRVAERVVKAEDSDQVWKTWSDEARAAAAAARRGRSRGQGTGPSGAETSGGQSLEDIASQRNDRYKKPGGGPTRGTDFGENAKKSATTETWLHEPVEKTWSDEARAAAAEARRRNGGRGGAIGTGATHHELLTHHGYAPLGGPPVNGHTIYSHPGPDWAGSAYSVNHATGAWRHAYGPEVMAQGSDSESLNRHISTLHGKPIE
jgi:hypothetical protein